MNAQQQIPVQPMPVDYRTIETDDRADLDRQVKVLLDKGWLFHGPLIVDRSTQRTFIQPMTRLELRPMAMPQPRSNIVPATLVPS